MGFGTFCKDCKPLSTAVWQCMLPNLIISYFKQRQVNIHSTPEHSGTKGTIAAGVYNTPLRRKTKTMLKQCSNNLLKHSEIRKYPIQGCLYSQQAACTLLYVKLSQELSLKSMTEIHQLQLKLHRLLPGTSVPMAHGCCRTLSDVLQRRCYFVSEHRDAFVQIEVGMDLLSAGCDGGSHGKGRGKKKKKNTEKVVLHPGTVKGYSWAPWNTAIHSLSTLHNMKTSSPK